MVEKNTIDLRNKGVTVDAGEIGGKPLLDSGRGETALEWSAREREKKDRSASWHILIGAAALALAIVGIMTESYFFIAFIALAYGIFLMYEKRTPPEVSFTVSKEGVRVGKTVYGFSELKSFWIFRGVEPQELSLHTERTLIPYIRVPLRDVDTEQVQSFLRNFLPEEEHQEFISDHIERIL